MRERNIIQLRICDLSVEIRTEPREFDKHREETESDWGRSRAELARIRGICSWWRSEWRKERERERRERDLETRFSVRRRRRQRCFFTCRSLNTACNLQLQGSKDLERWHMEVGSVKMGTPNIPWNNSELYHQYNRVKNLRSGLGF